MTDKPRKVTRKKLQIMRSANAQAIGKPYRAIEGNSRKRPPITLPTLPWKSDDPRKSHESQD